MRLSIVPEKKRTAERVMEEMESVWTLDCSTDKVTPHLFADL